MAELEQLAACLLELVDERAVLRGRRLNLVAHVGEHLPPVLVDMVGSFGEQTVVGDPGGAVLGLQVGDPLLERCRA